MLHHLSLVISKISAEDICWQTAFYICQLLMYKKLCALLTDRADWGWRSILDYRGWTKVERRTAGAHRGLGCIKGPRCTSGGLRAESTLRRHCPVSLMCLAQARWTQGSRHLQRTLEPIQTCSSPAIRTRQVRVYGECMYLCLSSRMCMFHMCEWLCVGHHK